VQTASLGLLQCLLHDLFGDAFDLDVHLQGGDALSGTGDLEVHVAQVIFVTQDVGQDDEALAFLDQTHGDTRHRRLDRHAGVHQGQRRARQTEAIDEEPLDSVISETTRMVYGKASSDGITASTPRLARRPWPISRRFGPIMRPVSPTEYGGKL
jgi:hypothetical protein